MSVCEREHERQHERRHERWISKTRLWHYKSLQTDGWVQVETGIMRFNAAYHAGEFSYCDCGALPIISKPLTHRA